MLATSNMAASAMHLAVSFPRAPLRDSSSSTTCMESKVSHTLQLVLIITVYFHLFVSRLSCCTEGFQCEIICIFIDSKPVMSTSDWQDERKQSFMCEQGLTCLYSSRVIIPSLSVSCMLNKTAGRQTHSCQL